MRTYLIGLFLTIGFSAMAQRECATSAYISRELSVNSQAASRMQMVEQFIQQQQLAKPVGEDGASVIRIPVVVHVIYNNASQNISDAQIKSQIDALNRDFRRKNADSASTPQRFLSIAADVQIEFELAKVDPDGRATNGIVRKPTNTAYWNMDDKVKFSASGGSDGWNRDSYLNFWVCNLRSLLGYSSYVGGAAEKDGIVMNYTAFGTINTPAPYHLGRTAVHEVGHWLALKHIWGDTYCGDDSVDDTPKQGNFTNGCPTTFRSSCSNGEMGDMYMNYMDFTNDACMNMFSVGQKARMISLFGNGGPRASLLSSKGLGQPWNSTPEVEAAPIPEEVTVKLYPNPVRDELRIELKSRPGILGERVTITNSNGVVTKTLLIKSQIEKLNLADLRPGLYIIAGEGWQRKVMKM